MEESVKKLSEMSLDELWELFPIVLTCHCPEWADDYAGQAAVLWDALRGFKIERISHIGSTALEAIWAKPIIDLLVEIAGDEHMGRVADAIEQTGYLRMSQGEGRVSFNKGYTPQGFAKKVFHLHLRYVGDNDELYFRDYMKAHPEDAARYEQLKLGLWKKYEHDRDGYTQAKAAFVKKYTKEAKRIYPNRY